MRKEILFFALMCLVSFSTLSAQEKFEDLISVGDELVIGKPSKGDYQFIKVPKKNFIIKKGGIANTTSLVNNKVTVTKLVYHKNNNTIVTLKKSNGKKFFNAYRSIKANLNSAISSGELKSVKSGKSEEVAK